MNGLTTIFFGIRETFRSAWYVLLFVAVALLVFFLFVLIPTISVPGNSLLFQLSTFAPFDFVTTGVLSVLYALFVAMQVYAFRQKKNVSGLPAARLRASRGQALGSAQASVGTTAAGGIGALFAGIAGSAFCASCLAPLFALFGIGFGGVLFVLEYRFYIVAAIVFFMLIALYFTARKIQRDCASC